MCGRFSTPLGPVKNQTSAPLHHQKLLKTQPLPLEVAQAHSQRSSASRDRSATPSGSIPKKNHIAHTDLAASSRARSQTLSLSKRARSQTLAWSCKWNCVIIESAGDGADDEWGRDDEGNVDEGGEKFVKDLVMVRL
jgi:hypothetical protein